MNVDEVIDRFVEADQTLRELIDELEEVRTSRSKLDEARSDLGEARQEALEYLETARQRIAENIDEMNARTTAYVDHTVELAEQRLNRAIDSLTDASRRLQDVADPLKDSAQQLAEIASTWRTVRPQELHDGVVELRQSVRRQRLLLVVLVVVAVLNLAGVVAAVAV